MKSKITFKVLKNGRVTRNTVLITHPNFSIIPSEVFNNYKLSEISIESQVIDWLDTIDKSEIMSKYDWDIILDYYPHKPKKHKNEIQEFMDYLKPYVNLYPEITRPLEAIISEAKDTLFGRNKSNKTKAMEVFKMLDISLLTATGVYKSITKYMYDNRRRILQDYTS